MNRFWDDAASIFETAAAARNDADSEIAILVDSQKGLRIVDAAGWGLDALRREYQAAAAYTVRRAAGSVVVEARNESDHCMLKKSTAAKASTTLLDGVAHHLVRPASNQCLPAGSDTPVLNEVMQEGPGGLDRREADAALSFILRSLDEVLNRIEHCPNPLTLLLLLSA